MIAEYFRYQLGALEYRSVRFETEVLDCENYQGNAVVNYTEREVPYTRIIEHKHFEFGKQEKTVISREYSSEWSVGMEPYYPVNDEKNNALFEEYKKLAEKEENVIFGGRLGDYKYYDMDKVVAAALDKMCIRDRFFHHAVEVIEKAKDPAAARAYIYGFICHFALDSECHPYVEKIMQVGRVSHNEIEMELDRMMLTEDYHDPLRYLTAKHIQPKMEYAEVIAPFFKDVTAEQIYKALKGMVFYHKLFLACLLYTSRCV